MPEHADALSLDALRRLGGNEDEPVHLGNARSPPPCRLASWGCICRRP